MFTTRGIVIAWGVAGALAVTTLILVSLAWDQADEIAGSPNRVIAGPYPWLGNLPLLVLVLTIAAGLWAITAMVVAAIRTRNRERKHPPAV